MNKDIGGGGGGGPLNFRSMVHISASIPIFLSESER